MLGFAPRLRTHEPSFAPLSEAIEDLVEVSFDYRKPDGETNKRHVQPWLLRSIDGQWLVVCWDKDQKAVRNFLLKRIVSKVAVRTVQVNEKESELVRFEAPEPDLIQAAIQDLEAHTKSQVAKLKIRKDSQAWFHFNLGDEPRGDAEVSITYMDLHLLAEELSEYAHDISVLAPPELAKAIRIRFEAVANAHA
jgi:proteasome accessory factor B